MFYRINLRSLETVSLKKSNPRYEGIVHVTTQDSKSFNGAYHVAVQQDAITPNKQFVDTEFSQYPKAY